MHHLSLTGHAKTGDSKDAVSNREKQTALWNQINVSATTDVTEKETVAWTSIKCVLVSRHCSLFIVVSSIAYLF